MTLRPLTPKLKSLDQANAEVLSRNPIPVKWVRNGIGCPKCDYELMDSTEELDPELNPRQIKIKCSNCDYLGGRYI